jgi:cyclopropane fatty-acyl-phospholipid synthase-like methyltransferase
VSNIYKDGSYISLNPTWHTEDSLWKAKNIRKILDKNNISFSSVAEVGCGAGMILKELSRHYENATFYGYDISPDAMRLWINDDPRVRFSLEDFEVMGSNFDLLLVIDVLEHIEDYMGFLRRIHKRSEFFIFHIPLELSAQQVMRDIQLHTRASYGHIHYFSKATALATLSDTGFHVVDCFYTNANEQYVSMHSNYKMKVTNVARNVLFSFSPDFTVKLLGGYELMVLAEARD